MSSTPTPRELSRGGDTSLREASLALADELSKGRNSLLISMNGPAGKMVMELRLYDPDLFSSERGETNTPGGLNRDLSAGTSHSEPDGSATKPAISRSEDGASQGAAPILSSDKQVSSLDARIADLIDRLDRKLKYPVIHPSAKWTRLGAEAMIVLAEAGSALSARGATEQEPIAWRWRNKGGQWWYREDAPANPPAVPLESDAVIEPLYALPWSQYVNCQSPNEKK